VCPSAKSKEGLRCFLLWSFLVSHNQIAGMISLQRKSGKHARKFEK